MLKQIKAYLNNLILYVGWIICVSHNVDCTTEQTLKCNSPKAMEAHFCQEKKNRRNVRNDKNRHTQNDY